jgi:hypothetical protein
MIDRALVAVTNLPFEQRALIVHAANSPRPDFRSVIEMCVEQSRVDSEWSRACEAYGAAIERQHQTVTGQSYGIDLLLSLTSDSRLREELSTRRRLLEEKYMALQTALGGAVHVMIYSDPHYFEGYWNAVRQQGETEGLLGFAELEIPGFFRQLDLAGCASTVLNRIQ